MDIPITVCLAKPNFDKAMCDAKHEAIKAVAEYNEDMKFIKSYIALTCFEVVFVGVRSVIDLNGNDSILYSFKVTD